MFSSRHKGIKMYVSLLSICIQQRWDSIYLVQSLDHCVCYPSYQTLYISLEVAHTLYLFFRISHYFCDPDWKPLMLLPVAFNSFKKYWRVCLLHIGSKFISVCYELSRICKSIQKINFIFKIFIPTAICEVSNIL